MTLIELMTTDGVTVDGSVMIAPAFISEVEECGASVRIHMVSGNSYLVEGSSFGGMLNQIEGAQYLKVDRSVEAVEDAEITEE
ncbi:MAG: hypothetical protein ACRC6V_01125 [Bacteroidales bacterium]